MAEYKIITVISSDAEIIIEEFDSLTEAQIRQNELDESNSDFEQMKANAIVITGDIITHNIKNLNTFKHV